MIELDLFDLGVDVEDMTVMRSRSWRWLELRILDCVGRGRRMSRVFG